MQWRARSMALSRGWPSAAGAASATARAAAAAIRLLVLASIPCSYVEPAVPATAAEQVGSARAAFGRPPALGRHAIGRHPKVSEAATGGESIEASEAATGGESIEASQAQLGHRCESSAHREAHLGVGAIVEKRGMSIEG
jgi:hypothetical protein